MLPKPLLDAKKKFELTDEEVQQALMDLLTGREPFDRHFHRCPDCSHIWDHTASKLYEEDPSLGAFEKAHSCPKCGADNCTFKYFTEREAVKAGPGAGRFDHDEDLEEAA